MATYIEEAMQAHALAQTTVTSIISKRLYIDQAPQDAQRPYVVQSVVDPGSDTEEFGVLNAGQYLFQWSCTSDSPPFKTPTDGFLVAYALKAVFRDLRGTIQGMTIKYTFSKGPRALKLGGDDELTYIVEATVSYEGL